jgi:uncharacterized membrane protein (DUF106 family)
MIIICLITTALLILLYYCFITVTHLKQLKNSSRKFKLKLNE